jgi:hypothetical protein
MRGSYTILQLWHLANTKKRAMLIRGKSLLIDSADKE